MNLADQARRERGAGRMAVQAEGAIEIADVFVAEFVDQRIDISSGRARLRGMKHLNFRIAGSLRNVDRSYPR